MKAVLLVVVSTIVFAGCPNRVFACSCAETGLAQHYEAADLVFAGYPTAIRLQELPGERGGVRLRTIVEFRVVTSWKGSRGRTAIVRTGMGGGDCGSDFRVGIRYVVFAERKGDGMLTGICSGNMYLDNATRETLLQLDQMSDHRIDYPYERVTTEPIPRYAFPVLFAMGVLIIAVSIPLILRRIKPNVAYGVRFPATLENESVWYDMNALGGRHMVGIGVIYLVLLTIAWIFGEAWSLEARVLVPVGFLVVALVCDSVYLFIASNRLLKQKQETKRLR